MKRERLGLGRLLLAVLFPERCPFCDKVVRIGEGVCETCRYRFCRYWHKTPEELPDWMKKKGIAK